MLFAGVKAILVAVVDIGQGNSNESMQPITFYVKPTHLEPISPFIP